MRARKFMLFCGRLCGSYEHCAFLQGRIGADKARYTPSIASLRVVVDSRIIIITSSHTAASVNIVKTAGIPP